jgi:hypothetical protein
MKAIDQLRQEIDNRLCKKFKNIKCAKPYNYELKTKSGDKVEILFPQDEFLVYHNGVPTLKKKLAALTAEEIIQYVSYKFVM